MISIVNLFNIIIGNRVWSLYNFEKKSWEEQDEDCFDLDLVLEDCSRKWDP